VLLSLRSQRSAAGLLNKTTYAIVFCVHACVYLQVDDDDEQHSSYKHAQANFHPPQNKINVAILSLFYLERKRKIKNG